MPVSTTPASSASDSSLNVFFSEARQQNTEVRLSVAKVSDKVDRILEKVSIATVLFLWNPVDSYANDSNSCRSHMKVASTLLKQFR